MVTGGGAENTGLEKTARPSEQEDAKQVNDGPNVTK